MPINALVAATLQHINLRKAHEDEDDAALAIDLKMDGETDRDVLIRALGLEEVADVLAFQNLWRNDDPELPQRFFAIGDIYIGGEWRNHTLHFGRLEVPAVVIKKLRFTPIGKGRVLLQFSAAIDDPADAVQRWVIDHLHEGFNLKIEGPPDLLDRAANGAVKGGA